jgi:hypothetical protein
VFVAEGCMKAYELPNDFEMRLREWGGYFRDKRSKMRCGSAEGAYKPRAGDWGDEGDVPKESRLPRDELFLGRVLKTHEAIQIEGREPKWALTLAYCYRHLDKGRVLALMRKMTGRRFGWYAFLDCVDAAKIRVYCRLDS